MDEIKQPPQPKTREGAGMLLNLCDAHASLGLSGMSPTLSIFNFPMPPSVNQSLRPIRSGRMAGRLVKTKEAQKFERAYKQAAIKNQAVFKEAKTIFEKSLGPTSGLKVDCFFAFPLSKLVTKPGPDRKMKQLDANNRLKGAIDGLAFCLGIDDRHFISGNCEKIALSEANELGPHLIAVIQQQKLRHDVEIVQGIMKGFEK